MIYYPSIDLDDYPLPAEDATEDELELLMPDPVWRICNLYTISDKDGKAIPFRPNWAQRVVLYAIFIQGRKRIAIPKARQLGFSTLSAILALDKAYFNEGQESVIIERTQQDAWEKLKMVAFSYDKLDEALKEPEGSGADNRSEMSWSNGGSDKAGQNARGKDPNCLHIYEWGVIAYEDPNRSTEIKTGAIPAASGKESVIIAESTFKGGRAGDWYEIIVEALEVSDDNRTERDWTVLFFPWYLEPVYTLAGNVGQITPEVNKYLTEKGDELGIRFTDGQKLWYFKEQQPQNSGKWIKREYPTTIDEMWSVREEGQIYAGFVDKARQAGRINDDFRKYDNLPVYAVFDIGAPENTKCLIYQLVGDRKVYLEAFSGNGEDRATPAEWWAFLQGLGYRYGAIFLPHDGANPMVGSKGSWIEQMQKAGCSCVVTMKQPQSVWSNIVEAQANFGRCEFHKTGCEEAIRALECYHCKVEKDNETIRDVPVHDWASHFATCFGYSHQAEKDGLQVDRSSIPVRQGSAIKPRVSMARRPRR